MATNSNRECLRMCDMNVDLALWLTCRITLAPV
jgi:hypothetical protein